MVSSAMSMVWEMLVLREESDVADEIERAGGRSGERAGRGGDDGAGETESAGLVVTRERREARDCVDTRLGRG